MDLHFQAWRDGDGLFEDTLGTGSGGQLFGGLTGVRGGR